MRNAAQHKKGAKMKRFYAALNGTEKPEAIFHVAQLKKHLHVKRVLLLRFSFIIARILAANKILLKSIYRERINKTLPLSRFFGQIKSKGKNYQKTSANI